MTELTTKMVEGVILFPKMGWPVGRFPLLKTQNVSQLRFAAQGKKKILSSRYIERRYGVEILMHTAAYGVAITQTVMGIQWKKCWMKDHWFALMMDRARE